MNVAEQIIATGYLLIKRGWCQGCSYDGERICLARALAIVTNTVDSIEFPLRETDIFKYLSQRLHYKYLSDWNDQVATCLDDVILMLSRAADDWRKEHS